MRTADLLLQDYDIEISNTRRTLERVPDDVSHWTPHQKSTALGKLAMHCATIPLLGSYIMEDDGMDMAARRRPQPDLTYTKGEVCLQRLDQSAAVCRAALASASDETLAAPWKFTFGEQVISNNSRSLTFRQLCVNHLIHHTAQLGVYFRLLDIPVPALYGPSADEQWTHR